VTLRPAHGAPGNPIAIPGAQQVLAAAYDGGSLELLTGAASKTQACCSSAQAVQVSAGGQVYVRTWHRRTSGWFGLVVETGRARARVPGLEADVVIEDVGEGPGELRASVDAAYRAKYGRYGAGSVGPMVADEAAAATLRLTPEQAG